MEEFDFSELEWNRDGLVSSAYAEQIENYKPAWQKEWIAPCSRKCCFSPDCGKIPCEWCGEKIIVSCTNENAVDRFNCPECFYNPEVCVDFCQKCFNDKDVPHNRQQTSPNQGVYHRHTKFLHIDPKGQHTWVTREITEAANAKYHLLNPNIEDLPHREADPANDPQCFCYVEFEKEDEVVALSCGHCFHYECLEDRLASKSVPEPICPFCALKD